jgi:hypothetical protein
VIKKLRNEQKRADRRGYGVSAYVGANGSGKSAAMVWDCIPSLEAGRPVLATVRILDYENPRECDDPICEASGRLDHYTMRPTAEGRAASVRNQRRLFFEGDAAILEPVERVSLGVHRAAHPGWIPWESWEQLLKMDFGEVLADEMTGVAEARSAASLPTVVLNHTQQLRRADIPFRYTCPSWEQADISMRRVTQAVTICTGKLKKAAPSLGDQTRVWKSRRLYRWQTYDALGLTEMTDGKRQELRPEVADWHWGPGSPAWAAYDTFAPVLTVGVVSESGRCHRCGGRRSAPPCRCEHHAEGEAAQEGPPQGDTGAAPGRRRALKLAEN